MKLWQIVVTYLLGVLVGMHFGNRLTKEYINPKVDLPEEYKLMTEQDTIQGYYDKNTGVLYIYYNNKRNKP